MSARAGSTRSSLGLRGAPRVEQMVPLLCLLAVGTLLGVSTNLVRVAAETGLAPLSLLTWSTASAGAVLLTWSASTGRLPRGSWRTAEFVAVAALVGVVAPGLILYSAIPRVGASFVALALAFPPLFTWIGALALGMERFDPKRAAGVALALAGVAWLAGLQLRRPDASPVWVGAALITPAIVAAGNLYRTRRWPEAARPDELAPGVAAAAGAALLASAWILDVPLADAVVAPGSALLIGAQAAVLTAQYRLFFVLQQRGGPVYLSLLGAVGAIVGVPIATLLVGEVPPEGLALGGALIGVGVILVSLGSRAATAASAPQGPPTAVAAPARARTLRVDRRIARSARPAAATPGTGRRAAPRTPTLTRAVPCRRGRAAPRRAP